MNDTSFSPLGAWSLLPPIAVLLLGYFFRTFKYGIAFALVFGVYLAAFLTCDFAFFPTLKLGTLKIWSNLEIATLLNPHTFWNCWNAFICIFLFALGIIVALMHHSGGSFAYRKYVGARLDSKKSAETSSLMLSSIFFVDDYFSSLTVGNVMTPLTDKFQIPRAKTAFLVDAMAAPLTILCPFSSWVAAIIGFFRDNGIHSQGTHVLISSFGAYFRVIPYIIYSFLLIGSVWFIVRKQISFGSMAYHEHIAKKTGDLHGGGKKFKARGNFCHVTPEDSSLLDFLLPPFFLILSIIFSLLYVGDFHLFGGDNSFINAIQKTNAASALFIASLIALVLSLLYFLAKKSIRIKEVPGIFFEGIQLVAPALLILLLAWTLGDIVRSDLKSGDYLAHLLLGNIPPFSLPVIAFVTACLVASSTGSSWGAAAILFPIVIPLVFSFSGATNLPASPEEVPLLFPVLGAVLSGGVAGDHISPLSDTTFMASTSVGCSYFDHVRTQLTYAFPVICASAISFLLIGIFVQEEFFVALVLPLLAGVITSFAILSLRHRFHLKRKRA